MKGAGTNVTNNASRDRPVGTRARISRGQSRVPDPGDARVGDVVPIVLADVADESGSGAGMIERINREQPFFWWPQTIHAVRPWRIWLWWKWRIVIPYDPLFVITIQPRRRGADRLPAWVWRWEVKSGDPLYPGRDTRTLIGARWVRFRLRRQRDRAKARRRLL